MIAMHLTYDFSFPSHSNQQRFWEISTFTEYFNVCIIAYLRFKFTFKPKMKE